MGRWFVIIHAGDSRPLMDPALFGALSLEIDNYSAEEANLRRPTFLLRRNDCGVTRM